MNSVKFMGLGMLAGLVAIAVIGGSFLVGRETAGDGEDDGRAGFEVGPDDTSAEDFAILEEIYEVLEDDFLRPGDIDRENLRDAAIQGMLETLGDENTVYIEPEVLAAGGFNSSGVYEGIGASVTQDPQTGEIVIITPFTGSPAEAAGVQPGDVLIEVEGESTAGWSVDQAVNVIRGPRGTEVTIVVRHLDGSEEEFTIERNEVEISTVFSCPGVDLNGTPSDEDLGVDCPLSELDGSEVSDIAYLRIEQFTGTAPDDVEEALEAVADGNYRGLIIDLRNNPGGLVTATVDISDMFLEEGQIFREVDSDGNEQVYDAAGDDILDGLPVVILVNDLSASGSEVFAAALQQNDARGYVIGDVTFGKGTVNILRELSDGGGLYVSTAQWFTPNDERIENVGISPDLEFCATDQEIDDSVDSQLQAAIDYLQGEDVEAQSCGPSQQAASE